MGWRSATREFDVLLFALTVCAFLTSVSVGSEEARFRVSLRPPLKLHAHISRMQLSRRLTAAETHSGTGGTLTLLNNTLLNTHYARC